MERKTPMKRTEFKQSASLKRSIKAIAAVSKTKKRRREQKAGPSMAELRPILWVRCGGHCEHCGCTVRFETFDAHHRKFRSRGGLDRIENLVALCGECHLWAHREGRQAGLAGFSVMASAEPGTIPIQAHAFSYAPGRPKVYLTTTGGYYTKPV